jgi:hypothetical protein
VKIIFDLHESTYELRSGHASRIKIIPGRLFSDTSLLCGLINIEQPMNNHAHAVVGQQTPSGVN